MNDQKMSYEELQEQHQLASLQVGALTDELAKAHYELSKYKALYTAGAKKNEDLTIEIKELEGKINQKQPKAAK
ncbi:hypothetical protein [Bacillus licheniformis]|uniref:hypothetical protein n=1 Tax=Bacillus licheniformis TaxID=1402 RepID=UPI000B8AA37B|nr:hypothetical protein [Bacillus licheniformis]MCA1183496.1 hypothetical protein [Bacillus licheniformis]MEC1351701.1 hypothetical protein [Bacillus licheniformis]MED4411008.1 hypothetical protein [Bacillus licheniformis]RCK12338.1 hypothetical protein DT075_14510 [Bacillus licheniformis]TWK98026.1 hypothetical protein CHCC20327_2822 [Bacillus licheniformis]